MKFLSTDRVKSCENFNLFIDFFDVYTVQYTFKQTNKPSAEQTNNLNID